MKDDSFSHPSRRRVLQGVAAFGALGAPAVLRFARRIGLRTTRPGAPGSGFRQRFALRAVERLARAMASEAGTRRLAVRVRPTRVMAPTTWKPPSFRCTSCETSRITGKSAVRSTWVRIVSPTFRISSVSGGVSTWRLSASTVTSRCERSGSPG